MLAAASASVIQNISREKSSNLCLIILQIRDTHEPMISEELSLMLTDKILCWKQKASGYAYQFNVSIMARCKYFNLACL